MKIFLVVVSALGPFWETVPTTIRQMPGMTSCRAVADAILEMSGRRTQARCIAAYKDYN